MTDCFYEVYNISFVLYHIKHYMPIYGGQVFYGPPCTMYTARVSNFSSLQNYRTHIRVVSVLNYNNTESCPVLRTFKQRRRVLLCRTIPDHAVVYL